MKFNDRNDGGFFIGGAEIACFIIINLMMLASFGLGSSIRKTQDAKYIAKQLEERQKREEAEAARKKALQEREKNEKNLQAAKKDAPKVGEVGEAAANSRQRNLNTTIAAVAPEEFKKVLTVKPKLPEIKKQNEGEVKTVAAVKPPDIFKKTDEVQTAAAAKDSIEAEIESAEAESGFASRMSSLFFGDIDSLGVELYDYKLTQNTAGREIVFLNLLNSLKLGPIKDTPAAAHYHLAVSTFEAALNYKNHAGSEAAENTVEAVETGRQKTGEAILKPKKIAAKFLHNYKNQVYIATNSGLFHIPFGQVPEIKEGEKIKKSSIERYLSENLPPGDIIAIAGGQGGKESERNEGSEEEGGGGRVLFAGTPSTVYSIDLAGGSVTDIGIDELFENSLWYSMCFYDDKLYFANYEALFYYDIKAAKWFTVAYEKFAGFNKCALQSLVVYRHPAALHLNYMLVTKDYGIITDKMPSFDPAAFKYENAQAKPKILKKLFNRDLLKAGPAFVYNEPDSVWFSFEPHEKEPYELIRYDKKTEKYERYNQSNKIKCVYAIDMVQYNENLFFAVNGEDVFAIIRMWGDNNAKIYGFYSIASVSGCFSIACTGKFVICGTLDGQIYKIDASDLIESAGKL